jgi:transporter family-2 protein
MPFEMLHGALVLFRRGARFEGAQIAALARLRIDLARIEPVLAGLQFPDHGFASYRNFCRVNDRAGGLVPASLQFADNGTVVPPNQQQGTHVQAIYLYVLAIGAGVSVATQQVLNGSLRTSLGSPAWAGFFSYLGGLLTMVVVLFALGEQLPSWKAVTGTPWWAWSGGVLGGVFILLVILLLPSLGAATLIALVVAGQMLLTITLDHFGAFGLTPHPVSLLRLLGAVLLIGGVVLIRD